MKRTRFRLALAVASALALLDPSPALAQTCTHEDGVMTITGSSASSSPLDFTIEVLADGRIHVSVPTQQIICQEAGADAPTVLNTDTIRVIGEAPTFAPTIELGGGPFAPGRTPEPDGFSEIEFEIDLSASPDRSPDEIDVVIVQAMGISDSIRTAVVSGPLTEGVNLNAAEPAPDIDIVASSVEGLIVESGDGNDRIIGSAAFPVELFVGGPGNDILGGGAGLDLLSGESGNDRLNGGGGADILIGGRGRDRCAGGPGRERVKGCETGPSRDG